MKDVKTLGDEEEEEVEDSTLDVMETQDEDVQGKEKEGRTLLNSLRLWWKNTSKIQRRRMWKMKTSKIQRPKNTEKIWRADIPHATFALCDRWEEKKQSKTLA